jgi:GT2 family glycosyltransferase
LGLRERPARARLNIIAPVKEHPPVSVHTTSVDIIVCVRNPLEDVRRCLDSVLDYTAQPYRLILVDDGIDGPTRDFLTTFTDRHSALLLRSEAGMEDTIAAHRGLRASNADFALLLPDDTIVTPRWLDRMIACAESDPCIGMVEPLSNMAAGLSSTPVPIGDTDAKHSQSEGMTVAEIGEWIAKVSARLYPRQKRRHASCLLLRREMLVEMGYFDPKNDLVSQARVMGWDLALADDTYVYQLSERANELLPGNPENKTNEMNLAACDEDRVMVGIHARTRRLFERRKLICQGRERFAGHKVLFVLPTPGAGGGANIVISEAKAMQAMGVSIALFNLDVCRVGFEQAYAEMDIPIIYGNEKDLPIIAARYDAIVATHNISVAWLTSIKTAQGRPVKAYYIQDFEPFFYAPESDGYQVALDSYTLFPDLVRFTKTEWTRQAVFAATGANAEVVGPSFEVDLFRPRPRREPDIMARHGIDRPLRVAAMIRPSSPRRSPEMTMRLLEQAMTQYPHQVEAWLFGTNLSDPLFRQLPHDFGWLLGGVLNPGQVANFLNKTDIFVDFSTHQAMGLTAMEAMGCGNAVIVPQNGGSTSFTRHEHNGLVVDTTSEAACWAALERLLTDRALRRRLQCQAINDICDFYAERPAYNILHILFEK